MKGALKRLRPDSPGRRFVVSVDRSHLWKGRPVKALVSPLRSKGGRNMQGRVTSWHRGGGHKKLYRAMDFMRNDSSLTIERVEYDPNRSAFISLAVNEAGERKYILSALGQKTGDTIHSGTGVDAALGNVLPLKEIPSGSFVHSLEIVPGGGGRLVRSAGSKAQVIGQDDEKYTLVRLPSREIRKINSKCKATLGGVSNPDHKNRNLGKAGRKRWLGWRPVVRGVAMNPIDHPHGGGEGRTSGGRHPVTPWGVGTKGKKTRKKNKMSNKFIVHKRGVR